MKQSYEITINRNQGNYKGIVTKGVVRDYFEPAFSGQAFAHDIIEHPIIPHPNPYIDEIMALGAFASGRVSSGWCNRSFFSTESVRPSAVKFPIGDIIKHDYLHGDRTLQKLSKRLSYIKDAGFMKTYRKAFKNTLRDYFEGRSHEIKKYDISTLMSYFVDGYRAHRKRFKGLDINAISTDLFYEISDVGDKFIRESVDGDCATVHIDFKKLTVELVKN
jgi:hypothetical protein